MAIFIPNPAILPALIQMTKDDVHDIAEDIKEKASSLAPVETGALAASGVVVDNPAGGSRVEFTVDYAGFVEFGTIYMEAQPYLRRALG